MDVQVPKMGTSTVEVDVTRLLVRAGQHVEKGDPIAEIEGDKSSLLLEAQEGGVITEVLVREGGVCHVGDVICRLERDTE